MKELLCIIIAMGALGCGSAPTNKVHLKKENREKVYRCSFSDKGEQSGLWFSMVIEVDGVLTDVSGNAGTSSDRIELSARCAESYIN